MKITTIAAAVLALGAGTPVWAVPAGRVLAVAGSATIERDGQQLPLQMGATVESGDVLAVGDKSTLQVRFTDESVVALRANSQFRIDNYKFDKNTDTDRSLMGLLKGGMRTITGLIGKANQTNYRVQTPTATIGIRGTHFTVVSCNNDCTRPDGSPERNGTFGGVTDGRISVSNGAGAREFGQQDSFHVPSANALPVRLLVPPAILGDRGAAARGRSTAASSSTQDGSASSGSSNGSSARTSTSPQLTEQRAPVIELITPLTTVSVTSQPAIVSSGGSGSGKITLVEFKGFANLTGDFTQLNAENLTLTQFRARVDEVRNTNILFFNAQTFVAAFPTARTFGSSAAAGAYWTYDPPDRGSVNSLGEHHIIGDTPSIALPSSGLAQYNYAGGTAPTDNYGRVGTFSGSNLVMNFGSQQIKSLSTMTMSFGTNALQTTATTYAIPANTTWAMVGGPSVLSGTVCTSGCTGTSTGAIVGRFVGDTMQGYISAIKVTNTQLNTGQANVAGNVAAFARQ